MKNTKNTEVRAPLLRIAPAFWTPSTGLEVEVERLRELSRAVWFAEQRHEGAALFFLPDASGQPSGNPVAASSVVFREWLGARYAATYGAAPSTRALDAFVSGASMLSRFPAQAVRRKSADFTK